jgi:glycosyltransferase involved in cell wall biosynthesis
VKNSGEYISEKLKELNVAILVPTYNNEKTLAEVINSLLVYTNDIYVVNDGSTDSTPDILLNFQSQIKSISYNKNKGKGFALKTGIKAILNDGYKYAISIDSDGQHYATDLEVFIENIIKYPDSILVGNRGFNHENMNGQSTFANKFSNFWFTLQTTIELPDTQSGYRTYPLHKMGKMHLWTNRYETELEVLVFSAWRGVDIKPVGISVYYPPVNERVSHFRPFNDFFRISILNTVLVILAVIYGYPRILITKLINNINNILH